MKSTEKAQNKKTGGITMKREIRDSVFKFIFEEEKYRYQLYKFLHPRDNNVKPHDVKVASLKSVLADKILNDLCLLVGNRLLIFVEAQSCHIDTLPYRMFLYAGETYKEYTHEEKLDIHRGPITAPDAEFYTVYTGEAKNVPSVLKLADTFKGMPMKIRVLKGQSKRGWNIVYQYVRFCKIANTMRKRYPNDKHRAILETIKQCLQEGILTEILTERQKEVVEAMDILFDQEYINEIHDKTIRAESRAEGRAEGKAEGLAEGRVEGIAVGKTEGMAIGKTEGMVEGLKKGKVEAKIEIAEKLLKAGIMSMKQIAELTEISIYKLRKIKAQMNVS